MDQSATTPRTWWSTLVRRSVKLVNLTPDSGAAPKTNERVSILSTEFPLQLQIANYKRHSFVISQGTRRLPYPTRSRMQHGYGTPVRIDGASGMFTAKTSALQLPHGAKYPGAGCSFALRHRYQNGTGYVAEPTRQKGLHAKSEHVVALGIGPERLQSPSVGEEAEF
uniref:Uncharacterized protein n=1 Tax=Anopheles melas TaxID=34690 RepID=A0A182TFR3_9DIPT